MPHAHKAGRNDPCPCGSGRKYKKCCEGKSARTRVSKLLIGTVIAALAGALYAGYAGLNDEGTATAAPGRVWSPEHGHYH